MIALTIYYNNTRKPLINIFFFFNDTATTEIYTLSLHDALPILYGERVVEPEEPGVRAPENLNHHRDFRSEEHTSELQSQSNLVCRLLLEKKKKNNYRVMHQRRNLSARAADCGDGSEVVVRASAR